jgi:hypothetical protein
MEVHHGIFLKDEKSNDMKKKSYYFLILILLISCRKESLPEVTMNGENTFGMVVNGSIWQPYMPGIFGPGNKRPNIVYYPNHRLLRFNILNVDTKENFEFTINDVSDTGFYKASVNMILAITGPNFPFNCLDTSRFERNHNCRESFKLDKAINSSIKITRFDSVNKVVSGEFNMILINAKPDTLFINSGRFDSEYAEQL